MPRSAEEFSELGKVGIHARLATEDPRSMTQAALEGQWRKYLDEADPEGVLDPAERIRRATALRNARMARMRLARAVASRQAAEAAERARAAAKQARAAAKQARAAGAV